MTDDQRFTGMRRAIQRDIERFGRPRDGRGFLRALSLIGSVGWPIALLTSGGAVVGHVLDRRLGGGVAATLGLLVCGAVGGSLLALRALRGDRRGR